MPNAAPPLHRAARDRAAEVTSPPASRTGASMAASAVAAPPSTSSPDGALTGVPASWAGFGALLAGAGERAPGDAPPKKDRLTRCLTCGVRAHYKLTYTVEKNRTRERTCRACFWKAWAADKRTEDWYEPRVYSREQIVRHLDANGWELIGTLAPVTEGSEPVLGKCHRCGKIRAARMGDFGWGCVCSRNTRSTHPSDKPTGKVRLADSGADALDW
jgi:hypothetical protein